MITYFTDKETNTNVWITCQMFFEPDVLLTDRSPHANMPLGFRFLAVALIQCLCFFYKSKITWVVYVSSNDEIPFIRLLNLGFGVKCLQGLISGEITHI